MPITSQLIARRSSALVIYNDLHASDGVTAPAWFACAHELREVAAEMDLAGCTRDEVRYVADRATDAKHEGKACERRTKMAADRWTGLSASEGAKAIIEVAS